MNYNFDKITDRTGTSCVKWDLRKQIFGTDDVIPMWVADMDFKTPDFVIDAIKKRASHEILGYTVRPDGYYNSIISWVKQRHHWTIEKDWILFSPGIVPAVNMVVMAYTNPGDKIIVQPPVYFPFFSAVKENNRQIVYNQLKLENDRYRIDFDDLEKKITNNVKMLILSNPHNPVSRAWTKEELKQLAEICIKNNVLIVSDEIHSDLALKPYKHTVMAGISEEIAAKTITMMAPSKTFNLAGMSTSSVIISDPDLRKPFQSFTETMHIGMGNIFGAVASEAAYTSGALWLDELLGYIRENIEIVRNYLKNEIPQIKMIEPEATYMVWLDFHSLGMNDKALQKFVIEKAKLGLSDGPHFGPGGSGFQRMNLACPKSVLMEALVSLKNAIESI